MLFQSDGPSSTASRLHILVLWLVTWLLYVFGLGARDFWAPVEPRYAEIARVLFIKSEWIVPSVNGGLYTDKPILYFWLVLIASKIYGGVNEWTVRLPVAFGGLGFVLTTYLIGRDFLGARTGFYAAIILATSMRVLWESRWAHVDTLFCFFFALAVYFGARMIFRKAQSEYEILFAYALMALAVLTKGLIGVVLPGLLFVAWVVAQRDWRCIGEAKLPLGIVVFLIVAAPWFYLVYQATDGKWLSDFIYIHHIQRYTAGAGHRQPFYYYLTTLPVDFLPWTIFALTAVFDFRSYRQARKDAVKRFFILWFFVVFIFFTLSDTKRDLYLMPLLPVLALFVANYLIKLQDGSAPHSAVYRWLIASFFAAVAIAGVALPYVAWFFRREVFWLLLPSSAVFALGGVLVVTSVRLRRPGMVLAGVASLITLGIITASLWIFPYVERFKSHRRFSQEIRRIVPPRSTLFVYDSRRYDF